MSLNPDVPMIFIHSQSAEYFNAFFLKTIFYYGRYRTTRKGYVSLSIGSRVFILIALFLHLSYNGLLQA